MTELIEINFLKASRLDQLSPLKLSKSTSSASKEDQLYKDFNKQKQDIFTFTLTQNKSSLHLFFIINIKKQFMTVRIHLLTERGEILKIDSQTSRNHFLRKSISSNQYYQARINPQSGQIYFRIDFSFNKKYQQITSIMQIKPLLQYIDLEKLNKSIKKLKLNFEMQNQMKHSHNHQYFYQQQNKCFKQLSKVVSQLTNINHRGQIFNSFLFSSQASDSKTFSLMNFLSDLNILTNQQYLQNQQHQITDELKLKKYLFSLQQQKILTKTLTQRKNGKSNFDVLAINLSQYKQMTQIMTEMMTRDVGQRTLKVVQSELGKITLSFQRQDERQYIEKIKLLTSLPKHTQYYFLDKYFKHRTNLPISVFLSLKEQELKKYLEKNKLTVSFHTRFRIFLQIITSSYSFWEQRSIILNLKNIKQIFLTKNLTVKLRNIHNYFKAEPYMLLQNKNQVNKKLFENILHLGELYFQILFNHPFVYIRPSNKKVRQFPLNEVIVYSQLYDKLIFTQFVPQGYNGVEKQLILGLNYIFLSFIHGAKQLEDYPKGEFLQGQFFVPRKDIEKQIDQFSNEENEQKIMNYRYICSWLLQGFEAINK